MSVCLEHSRCSRNVSRNDSSMLYLSGGAEKVRSSRNGLDVTVDGKLGNDSTWLRMIN